MGSRMARLGSYPRGVRAGFVTAAALVALWCAGGPAAAQPALNSGPMIHLSERMVELGDLPQHERREHAFRIENRGTAPLAITKIETTCSCTAAIASDSVLAPGETTDLNVTYNTKDKEGEETQIVVLYTNDPAEPRIDLVVKANVIPFVRVGPRILDFGPVHRGDSKTLSAEFEADPGTGFAVSSVEGGDEWVTWKISPVPGALNPTWRVEAMLRPDVPLGRFMKRADVKMQHPHRTQEALTVKGLIYSYFILEKAKFDFLTVQAGKAVVRSMVIDCDGTRSYQITGVTSSTDRLKPRLARKGKGYELTVDFLPGSQAGTTEETLTLATTDPKEPKIEIPVRAKVRVSGN